MENQAETQKLLMVALSLSVAERYRLAFLIAESLGYTLMKDEEMNMSNCELCGEPMPKGEEMFKFHGHSGPCPKAPLPAKTDGRIEELRAYYNDLLTLQDQADTVPLTKALDAVGLALEMLSAAPSRS